MSKVQRFYCWEIRFVFGASVFRKIHILQPLCLFCKLLKCSLIQAFLASDVYWGSGDSSSAPPRHTATVCALHHLFSSKERLEEESQAVSALLRFSPNYGFLQGKLQLDVSEHTVV